MAFQDRIPDSQPGNRRPGGAVPPLELPPAEAARGGSLPKYGRFTRKYALLAVLMVVLGCAGGFLAVVLQTPLYKARAILEIQGINQQFLKSTLETRGLDDTTVNIQTQIKLMQTASFLRRVRERLQSETVPPAPVQTDLFSSLRARLRTSTPDPMAAMTEGLAKALATYDARPIDGTRLIEISCDSTNPNVAAHFVNTLAAEYIEQNGQARSQSQKTGQWLTAQLEEARTRYQEAEDRLRQFISQSGVAFEDQTESTQANSKLRQLQGDLAASQADRILKQSRHELTKNSPPESLPEVLEDENLRSYQSKITELKRELAAPETTVTPDEVQRVRAQIADLEATLQNEVASVARRIRNDYEAAVRRERLLGSTYATQSQQVALQARKAAEFSTLRREVEIAKQAHNALLLQANQTNLTTSIPVISVRVADPSTPAQAPYKPRPILNMGFGVLAGLLVTVGIAFLRETLDRSVKAPGHAPSFLHVPELGVIPSASLHPVAAGRRLRPRLRGQEPAVPNGDAEMVLPGTMNSLELVAWHSTPSFLTESFRVALASLMREGPSGEAPQVILVTSPGPGEGKTTIVSNLGVALWETGRKVALVDADFRRPRLHRVFQLPASWGLCNLLNEQTPPQGYSAESLALSGPLEGLYVLPNGAGVRSIQKAVYSARFEELIAEMREHFHVILVDAPPLLQFADARVMARLTDGVVMVIRSGVTDQTSANEAAQRLHEDQIPLLGTILNDWKPQKSARDHYKHYYNYTRRGEDT